MAGRPLRRARMNASFYERPEGSLWSEVNEYGEGDNTDIALSEVPYELRRDIGGIKNENRHSLPEGFDPATSHVLVAWGPDEGYAIILTDDADIQIMKLAEYIPTEKDALLAAKAAVYRFNTPLHEAMVRMPGHKILAVYSTHMVGLEPNWSLSL